MSEGKDLSPFRSSGPSFNAPHQTGSSFTSSTGGSFVSTTGTEETSQTSSQVSQALFHASQASSGRVHASNANVDAIGRMPVYSSVLPTPAARPMWLSYSSSGGGSFESRATVASSQASQISSRVFQAPSVNYNATGQMPDA